MPLSSLTNFDTMFDGWGTELIIFVVSLILGGGIVTCHKLKVSQKQKAGNNANQKQIIRKSTTKEIDITSQKQKAADNAEQSQSI